MSPSGRGLLACGGPCEVPGQGPGLGRAGHRLGNAFCSVLTTTPQGTGGSVRREETETRGAVGLAAGHRSRARELGSPSLTPVRVPRLCHSCPRAWSRARLAGGPWQTAGRRKSGGHPERARRPEGARGRAERAGGRPRRAGCGAPTPSARPSVRSPRCPLASAPPAGRAPPACFPCAALPGPEGRFPEPALTPGTHLPGSKGPCQPGLMKDGESLAAAHGCRGPFVSCPRSPGLAAPAQPRGNLATLRPPGAPALGKQTSEEEEESPSPGPAARGGREGTPTPLAQGRGCESLTLCVGVLLVGARWRRGCLHWVSPGGRRSIDREEGCSRSKAWRFGTITPKGTSGPK